MSFLRILRFLSMRNALAFSLVVALFLSAINSRSESLDAAINYGAGGTFYLDSFTTYEGGAYVTSDTLIFGNGATCQLTGQQSIAVVNGASLEIRQCHIDGGYVAADGTLGPTSLTVIDTDFQNSSSNSIYATQASLVVQNSTFSSTDYGISASSALVEEIGGCVFTGCREAGISANNTEIQSLSNCTFSDTSGNGIVLTDHSSLRLQAPRSTFRNCYFGISSHSSSLWFGEDSLACEDCANALFIDNSPVSVELVGISIRNSSENAIVFSSSLPGAYIRLSRCFLDRGDIGISMARDTHLVINDSDSGSSTTIQGFLNGIILNDGCSAQIHDTYTTGCTGNAVYIDGAGDVLLDNCVFENNANDAPYVANKAFCVSASAVTSLTIQGCIFKNSDKAVFANNGTTLLVDCCTFSNCRYLEGVGIHNGSAGTVRNSSFDSCLAGISVQNQGRAWIYNNTINHSMRIEEHVTPFGQGLFVQGNSIADIADNIITECDNEGIYLEASSGSVVHNYIYNNGHVVPDGNGVFCHYSDFVVMDNFICNNYLNGVSVEGSPSRIYQNDIRYNNRGGIQSTFLANTDIRFNLCYQNDYTQSPTILPMEVSVEKTGSVAYVANNTMTANRYAGIGIAENAYATVIGNLILDNARYNANLYNGANALIYGNVLDNTEHGVFLNYSQVDSVNYNQITNSSFECANSINGSTDLDFRYNWWGHSSGPYSLQNPSGQGCHTENVDSSNWLPASFAYYAVYDNIAMGQDEMRIFESSAVPPVKVFFQTNRALTDEVFSLYLSFGIDIFPDYPYSGGGQIGNGVYLCLNASYGLRNWMEACEIRIYPDYAFGPISIYNLRLKRLNIETGDWELIPAFYSPSLGCLVLRVEDPQGAYIFVEDTSWRIGFDFIQDSENWTNGGAPVVFTLPDFSWEPEYLKIISTTNTNTFGFWQSPQDAVPAEQQYLYRARFTVSTGVTDQSLVPQIRLRANSSNLQQYDVLSIESAGDGDASPAVAGTDYDLYFVPPANETTMVLAFDLLNFNPFDAAVAEFALDTVTVDRFALDSLSTPTVLQDYTFDVSTDGWTTGGAPVVFSSPQYIHAGGAVELRATTNTNTFGFWGNDPADIMIEADKLYHGTFEVRTDVTNPAIVPEMRLRFNVGNLQASHTHGIASASDGANSPITTNTSYDRLYFLPPANCVGEDLLVSFDILNFDPDDAATASLILDRATIETLPIPSLP